MIPPPIRGIGSSRRGRPSAQRPGARPRRSRCALPGLRRLTVLTALLALTATGLIVTPTPPASAEITGRDLLTGTWTGPEGSYTDGQSLVVSGEDAFVHGDVADSCKPLHQLRKISGGWSSYTAERSTNCPTYPHNFWESLTVGMSAEGNVLTMFISGGYNQSAIGPGAWYTRTVSDAAKCGSRTITWEEAFADVAAMEAAGASEKEITDYRMYPCSGYEKCDGVQVSPVESLEFLRSIGYDSLTDSEKAEAREGVCTVLALFDADSYELAAASEPALAEVAVAGAGAPQGKYAKPSTTRSDGSVSDCPYYSQAAVLRAKQDVVDLGGFGDRLHVWIQRNVFQKPDSEIQHKFRLKKGDPLLSLTVTVEACTQNNKFTNVRPPVGGKPKWDADVPTAASFMGNVEPTSLRDSSYHDYTNKPINTRLESYAVADFPLDADLGVVKLPKGFSQPSDNTLGVLLTIYADGTWDYATSGTN